jgi:hypothetical protein
MLVGIELPQMLLPNLNFNVTYLGTDARGSVGETVQLGFFDRERAITEGGQKGSRVTKRWPAFKSPVSVAHCLARSRFTANLSSPSTPMNSYATEPEPSHGDLLADRLSRLDNLDDPSVQPPSHILPTPFPPNIAHRDGYGFRPPSGMASPRAAPTDRNSPLPDVNGLGWPGRYLLFS